MAKRYSRALLKLPARNFAEGQSSGSFGAPDMDLVLTQHDAYRAALEGCGLETVVLEADPLFPDSTFVEDTAVVTEEAAFIMSPGHTSRSGETVAIREALSRYRKVIDLPRWSRIDGGDVIRVERSFLVGLSGRTDRTGVGAFEEAVRPFGYTVTAVKIEGLLHLKSAVNYIGDGRMLVDERYLGLDILTPFEVIEVPAGEAYASNSLEVNGVILVPSGFQAVLELLRRERYPVVTVDMSEFMKMDGGLSCLSLRF